MKNLIIALAILFSGVASAQLYEVSSCGPAGNKTLHIDNQDYTVADNPFQDHIASFTSPDNLICLERNNSINRNWKSYFVNYKGATITEHPTLAGYIISGYSDTH